MKVLAISVILLLLFVRRINPSKYFERNLPYVFGKKVVNFLHKIPEISQDPPQDIFDFYEKIIKSTGIPTLFNGKPSTHQISVPRTTRAKRTNYEDIKHYWLYACMSSCETSAEEWNCSYCKMIGGQLIDFSVGFRYNTKVYIVLNPKRKEIVLTYRPTFNLVGVILDANIKPVNIKVSNVSEDIQVNEGTQDSTLIHHERNVNVLKRLLKRYPNFKLVVIGFSLGGAMATFQLFLFKYLNIFPNVAMELYTFGAPRHGNRGYAEFINDLPIPIARVHRGYDVVIFLYPAILGYYYHHNEVWVNVDPETNQTVVKYCRNDIYEDPTCVVSHGLTVLSYLGQGGINHYFQIPETDPSDCLFGNIVEFLIQIVWPIRYFLPPKIYKTFPKFSFSTTFFQEFSDLFNSQTTKIYRALADPASYNDPNYNLNNVIFT